MLNYPTPLTGLEEVKTKSDEATKDREDEAGKRADVAEPKQVVVEEAQEPTEDDGERKVVVEEIAENKRERKVVPTCAKVK